MTRPARVQTGAADDGGASQGTDGDQSVAAAFAATGWSGEFRRAQRIALDRLDEAAADGVAYLVLPPGTGKTLVGLEMARRAGRPVLVLGPNTAIQQQWLREWREFAPATVPATGDRALPTPFTALTYQSIAVFGATSDEDEEDAAPERAGDEAILGELHDNGRAVVDRLRTGGPWTIVLDECHHLLQLWGELLAAVLGELTDPSVIALTATPPRTMSADQAALHSRLFGRVDLEISTPAVVRDGQLAPYQELVYLTTPTPGEADYIAGERVRFEELRADLLDPRFAKTPFLDWVRSRVIERTAGSGAHVSWHRFERDEPDLAAAAVRLHVAGLLPLPDGARVREEHRSPPTVDDWIALLDDYCRRCLARSDDEHDERALESVRHALPAIGFRLTKTGIRAGMTPVDRVIARSASKATAAIEILHAEQDALGDGLRAVVLCDHERAAAELPARLVGVVDPHAGGARLLLDTLCADERSAALHPVLLTGRTVACSPATGEALVAWLATHSPELGAYTEGGSGDVVEVRGGAGWSPRTYVPGVTRFFEQGGTHCLVGTRALLGEGWDAQRVNVVVDLTAATTPTSVVQARGRSLRLDPRDPDKVADNWGVVCVADHPKGAADYERFVRKHDGYFALTRDGDIESGVSHVDPVLSPYAPPPADAFAEIDAGMLVRAGERSTVRERWRVGTPYTDEQQDTVIVRSRRSLGLPGRMVVPAAEGRGRGAPAGWAVACAGAAAAGALALLTWWVAAIVALVAGLAGCAVIRGARLLHGLPSASASGALEDIAAAVADGLHRAGVTASGAESVMLRPAPDGAYRATLDGVSEADATAFATALDEVVSPLAAPRYVVPRLVVDRPATGATRAGLAARRAVGLRLPATVVYHAVPERLGRNKGLAQAFGAAWNVWVSPGTPVYTGSPAGAGVLAAQRAADPFDVTTQMRTLWR